MSVVSVVTARKAGRFHLFSTYPASYWFLLLGTVITGVATFVLPFETLYLTSVRRLPVDQAALIMSLYGIGSCLAGLLGGVLSDRIGRRPVMIGGMVLLALTTALLGFASAPTVIAGLSFLVGFWTSVYRPASMAAVNDLVPLNQQGRANTLLYWGYNIGIAVSPLLAGWMIRAAGYSLLFVADSIGTLLFCLLIFVFVPESRPTSTPKVVVAPAGASPRHKGGVFRDGFFLVFVGLVFAIACLYFQSASTVPVDMSFHGMNIAEYSLALSCNGLAVIVFTLPLSRLFLRWSPFHALGVSAALMGLGFGLMALAGFTHSLPLYMVSVLVWTIGEIVYSPSSATVVAKHAPQHLRGTYQGIFRMAWGLASFAGPALGGFLLARVDSLLWIGCAGTGLVIGLGFSTLGLIVSHQQKKQLSAVRARFKYLVTLSWRERRFLRKLGKSQHLPAYQRLYAQILLQSDCQGGVPQTTEQICAALTVSQPTVIRVRRLFVNGGLGAMFALPASLTRPLWFARFSRKPVGSATIVHITPTITRPRLALAPIG